MAVPAAVAGAYASTARLADPAGTLGKSAGAGAAAGEPSFGALLKDALAAVGEVGRKSDAQTQALATGKADMIDVVTAVSETEIAVQTMVSIRDKVIEAYQNIMQMPI
jgi:flagellar hook-basal body complex protein FliE